MTLRQEPNLDSSPAGAAALRISVADTAPPPLPAAEDRFSRFKLIGWWDQAKLARAKVLVVGAGALGNEIVKNLALLGIGNVLIADMDRIENSNLSRSILYRAEDNGRFKAEAAAEAARNIWPQINAHPFVGNVVYDLGMGVYHWADVVLGGLDNREARLAINRNCWRVGRPWIDGAIEQIQGTARVFAPVDDAAPCYECTMSATDWKLLQHRRSCNLLSRPEMESGKTPTTPTISSIIAGVQCQEAVKLIHGLDTLAGKGFVFDGRTADSYQIEFQRKANCFSHETLETIIPLEAGVAEITARQLLAEARQLLGPEAELELGRDMLEKLRCPNCGKEEELFASLGKVPAAKAACPACGEAHREVVTFYKMRGNEAFLERTLEEIGVPAFDIIIARGSGRVVGFELAGDGATVLGPLNDAEALQWA